MPRRLAFSTSGLAHATLLGMVVFGNAARDEEAPKSLYDAAIRPSEKRVVWYHLQERLPDVSPVVPSSRGEARPLRATRKFDQRIVAGAKDDSRPPQLVWSPAPEVASPKMIALPNVLAVEWKRLTRPFAAPAPEVKAAELPDAAPAPGAFRVAGAGPNLAALTKTFTPSVSHVSAAVKLPEAAPAPDALAAAPAGSNLAMLKKTFTPPPPQVTATVKLPEAAPAPGVLAAAPAGSNLAALQKAFTPPPSQVAAAAKLPDAAPAPGSLATAAAGPNLAPLVKTFHAPLPDAAVPVQAPPDAPELAVIGLNPAKMPELLSPPDSRSAGFSAGPAPHPNGAETDGVPAGVAVPGVTVRDGVSRQALLSAVLPMAHVIPAGPPPPAPAMRSSAAPDPMLDGRVVYTMAIQMPNVTSYSGSWMVWYAAREQTSGKMRAPSPRRKVDPKYIASAVADGVEGVVRLGATIRRDGRVDAVKLLRHLDDRLDRSAMESLAKWEFEPAQHDGTAVDVDAVFEIPFRLAPKQSK